MTGCLPATLIFHTIITHTVTTTHILTTIITHVFTATHIDIGIRTHIDIGIRTHITGIEKLLNIFLEYGMGLLLRKVF